MANYNTFTLTTCKTNKAILTTSSARKALRGLEVGTRIDVWNENQLVETIYDRNRDAIKPYLEAERKYIGWKQKQAEKRNAAAALERARKDRNRGGPQRWQTSRT